MIFISRARNKTISEQTQKVFGIGFHRTGTKTLGACLKSLGFKHISCRSHLVKDVIADDLDKIWPIVDKYDSFDDWPWILIYKALDERYPGSKFILTVRKDSATWLKSIQAHCERRGHTKTHNLIYGTPLTRKTQDNYKVRYEAHNQEVLDYFKYRPADLLVVCWEHGDGWAEICRFLGKPIPNKPLPYRHKTKPSWQPWLVFMRTIRLKLNI